MRSALLVIESALGLLGFALHLWADRFTCPGATWHDCFTYGPPVFAPLLFTSLTLPAALGLWILARATRVTVE